MDEPRSVELVPAQSPAGQLLTLFADEQHLVELVSGWLARFKSDNTRDAYVRDFQRHWLPFLSKTGVPLLDVNSDLIAAFMRISEQEIDPRTGKPIKPATVARRVAVVSSFYKHAKRKGEIAVNPCEDTIRPDTDPDNSETVGLTADEAQRVIHAAQRRSEQAEQRLREAENQKGPTQRLHEAWLAAVRDATAVAVMLCTGGRVSETRATIEDLGYDRGHRVLFVTRKGGKRQPLVLGASAALVDRYIALTGRTTGPLFVTSRGTPVHRSWLFNVIRKAAEDAHIPAANRISPHSLRHTFATLAFDNGATLDEVQDAMGHADPRTTRRYDRARNRIDRSPAHKVSRALLGGGE